MLTVPLPRPGGVNKKLVKRKNFSKFSKRVVGGSLGVARGRVGDDGGRLGAPWGIDFLIGFWSLSGAPWRASGGLLRHLDSCLRGSPSGAVGSFLK